MKTLLLTLILTAATLAQPAKLPKNFSWEYDKFKDETLVIFNSVSVFAPNVKAPGPSVVELSAWFTFPGKTLAKNLQEPFIVNFRVGRYGCSSWCFIHDHDVIWLLDDKRMILATPKSYWDGSISPSHEDVTLALTRDELEQLTKAKKIEFQVGYSNYEIKPKDFHYFQDLLELATVTK